MDTEKKEWDINRPWKTLDPWQKKYIASDGNNFLLCGRQVGKTTAMSIKAVEDCMKNFKKGEFVLINSITEKQGYHMLAKCLAYAESKYPHQIDRKKENKPTMHRIIFRNGTGIYSYAAGETGEGLRGYTIKKLMVDEGSRMSEEYFIAVLPMLSVTRGSLDIASTPFGKIHKDGSEKFFYKCSKDNKFKKFYVSSEDCPRHTKEFLQQQKEQLSKLAYAQEYLAVFTDDLRRLISDELIKRCCVLKRQDIPLSRSSKYYLGVDVAGFGGDESTFEILELRPDKDILQVDNVFLKRIFTTETTKKIFELNQIYNFKKIGVDDAGVGFGVFSELMDDDRTKRKTEALNNASRDLDKDGTKHKKLLKEEMYLNFLSLMEHSKIKLLNDDEVKASLASIQFEDDKIFGAYSHIAEGLIRAAWLAKKGKDLNIFIHTF